MTRKRIILPLAFALGLAIGYAIDSIACQPADTVMVPTPAQHAAAIADGWTPGTDGYYRAIYGPDAY